jgi:septum formation protein
VARLVLASGSPQRRRILEDLGLDFEVRPTDAPEDEEGEPVAVAAANALRKARAAAAAGDGDELVLACDTVVATGHRLWGKPADAAHARATLRHLSGRTHDVISAVALLRGDDLRTADELTKVTFRALDDAAIERYVASGEWEGRAGGYAIQGRGGLLVRRLEGDYLNVVGLPVAALLGLCPGLADDFAA